MAPIVAPLIVPLVIAATELAVGACDTHAEPLLVSTFPVAPTAVNPVPPLATAIVEPLQVPDVIVPTVASVGNDVTALVARPPVVFTAIPRAVKIPVPVVVPDTAVPVVA